MSNCATKNWRVLSVFSLVLLGLMVPAGQVQASPKNVIFYIGDGMGFEQVEAAEIYTGTVMSFNDITKFPYTADCTTHSADNAITDSAAAGTALATGVKVNNGVISMASDEGIDVELLTLLEDPPALARTQQRSLGHAPLLLLLVDCLPFLALPGLPAVPGLGRSGGTAPRRYLLARSLAFALLPLRPIRLFPLWRVFFSRSVLFRAWLRLWAVLPPYRSRIPGV